MSRFLGARCESINDTENTQEQLVFTGKYGVLVLLDASMVRIINCIMHLHVSGY